MKELTKKTSSFFKKIIWLGLDVLGIVVVNQIQSFENLRTMVINLKNHPDNH